MCKISCVESIIHSYYSLQRLYDTGITSNPQPSLFPHFWTWIEAFQKQDHRDKKWMSFSLPEAGVFKAAHVQGPT